MIGPSLSLSASRRVGGFGPEIITNGTFATNDATGWTAAGSATLSGATGSLVITNGAAAEGRAEQVVSIVTGKRYKYSVTRLSGTAGGAMGMNAGAAFEDTTTRKALSTGVNVFTVVASSTGSLTLRIFSNSAVLGQSVTVDDISFREIL